MKRIFKIFLMGMLFICLAVSSNNIVTAKASDLSINTGGFKIDKKFITAHDYQVLNTPGIYPKEQVMGWLIIDFLGQYMQKSLTGYYGRVVPYWLTADSSQILEAKYVNDSSSFIIKLQVEPYLGAHWPIGLDNFTFKISLPDNDKVTLEKYEHIKSFKIPDRVKKQHLGLNLGN